MWFNFKKRAAHMYRDEIARRAFATASGRPKGADKLKKMRSAESEENKKKRKGWLARWFARSK